MIKNKGTVRLIIIALVGVMLILAAIQFKSFATTGKATVDILRIREKASTESEVIDVLGVDETFEIIGEEGDWYKISFKGQTGYVSKAYVDANGNVGNTNTQPETKPEENNNSQNNDNNGTPANNNADNTNNTENTDSTNKDSNQNNNSNKVTVTKKLHKISDNSNVNILPVITSEVIGEVKKDEQVQLLGSAGLWAYINSGTISGWIRIDKLSEEVIEATEEIDADNNENDNNSNEENNQNSEDSNADNDQNSDANNEDNTENQADENNTDNSNQDNNNTQAINYDSAKTLYVKVEAVNIRTESNTNSDIVTGLEQNESVKVIGEENDWYKVEVNGDKGFIRKDLLSTEKVEVTSRNNDFDRTTQTQVNNTNNAQNNEAQKKQSEPVQKAQSAPTPAPTQQAATSSSGVTGADIAAYAQQFVGCKYVYAAAGPNAFDCSGLTMYVYNHFGYSLSHSSKVQATQGRAVTGDLQPGDILVFSNDGKNVGHVGIYIGNDKFVHASDSSTGVIISNLHDSWNIKKYWGARRIL